MTDKEFSEYCREVTDAYFAEEEEMKAGIHPSQVKERIEKWMKDHNVNGEITFLEWNMAPPDHVNVSINNNYYGSFDYMKNDFTFLENKGWCIFYTPWEDMTGKPRVIGRFKTTVEKDQKLKEIYSSPEKSGFLDEELMTIQIVNDYWYMLER